MSSISLLGKAITCRAETGSVAQAILYTAQPGLCGAVAQLLQTHCILACGQRNHISKTEKLDLKLNLIRS